MPPSTALPYIPRLDSLRAIAALAVVYQHYFAALAPPRFATVTLGVGLFFVLSGYLITTILLAERGKPRLAAWMKFYIRRAFRIFPLYYFVLAAGSLLGIAGFTEALPWTLLYLQNFLIAHNQAWIGYASHLWSLAVEEQFYLVWPAVILCLRIRWAVLVCVSLIAGVFVYRSLAMDPNGPNFNFFLPWGSADQLCIGALCAIASKQYGSATVENVLRRALWITLPAFAVTTALLQLPVPKGSFVFGGVVTDGALTFFAWLVIRAVADGPAGSSWGGRWLPALGAISYGIYVYHFVVLFYVLSFENGTPNIPLRIGGVVLTIAISWLSWRFRFLWSYPIAAEIDSSGGGLNGWKVLQN